MQSSSEVASYFTGRGSTESRESSTGYGGRKAAICSRAGGSEQEGGSGSMPRLFLATPSLGILLAVLALVVVEFGDTSEASQTPVRWRAS